MKELEALRGLRLINAVGKYDYDFIENELDIIEKALTPPTADEVCEKLSEYSKTNIYYERGGFFYRNEYRYNQPFLVAIKYKSGLIELTKNVLPPHLITLIGRFYEGLEQ